MQLNDKLILELAVLAAATFLIAIGKLDPSVFLAILGVIFGERVYVAYRKQAV